MDQGEPTQSGLFETLRRLGATVLAIFQNRLELFTVELQEERIRVFNAVILTAVMAILGFLGTATATVALAIFLWRRFGMMGLLALSAVNLLVALLIYWRLRRRLKNWAFLSGTLTELKKDCECLGKNN